MGIFNKEHHLEMSAWLNIVLPFSFLDNEFSEIFKASAKR